MHYLVTWDSKKRVLERYSKSPYHHSNTDISIVTHSSVGRLHYLKDLLERWSGPLSLAIFAKWSEFSIIEDMMVDIKRSNIRIVLYIVDDRHPIQPNDNCIYHDYNTTEGVSLVCDRFNASIYPINTLRNLAINFIDTSHFLNLDMDLWPSCCLDNGVSPVDGLYEGLSLISTFLLNQDRIAFVLPAFQFTPKKRAICKEVENCFNSLSRYLPKDKPSLLRCMRNKVCQIANGFLPTHRFVDDDWWTFSTSVQDLPCIPYAIMEPYTLLKRTESTPLYDDNFINYGYNKVQFIDELEYKGYIFKVLTVGFGFDIPHKPSVYANMYEESWKVKKVINEDVYKDFLYRLHQEPSRKRQEICNYSSALLKYKNQF
ncbi:glycosyltransferase-like protein [Blastocystis sp. subtype 4]|uniref:glycosyltransferase-like protein n=1 Tax=Blastocystis sp. subtype 4 TaxID=944170 RepID=UPI0007118BEB|nr:glycosyltransferase-like protein [Blastocystis sp. subtype 4]KNB43828.1 glycosyltransferase-like protein [Blastocystis sp. subtype 4]|eukprot:XP_014527271.1 glycosyltransferase-like protein [Blastocystis sp. subtype 4]